MFESILAKNATVGAVYITPGGTTVNLRTGESVVWGYDRVTVCEICKTHVVLRTPWGTACNVARDYQLVTTPETALQQTPIPLARDKQKTISIPCKTAIEENLITIENIDKVLVEDGKKRRKFIRNLQDDVVHDMSAATGVSFQELSEKYQISIDRIKKIINKLVDDGAYDLIIVTGSRYRLLDKTTYVK